jgi:hypothetical protein
LPQPFDDVALAGHAMRSQFVRSMMAISLDNSLHEHAIRVDAIALELTDRIMRAANLLSCR